MNPPRLLAITAGDHAVGRDLGPWLRALGEAGLPAVLIREPHLDRDALTRIVDVAARWVPRVIVHARNPHAAALGLPTHGPGGAGRSCHSADALDQAFASAATYALLSPIWSPTSKPDDTRPPLGLPRYLALAAHRPVLALGGVDAARLAELVTAGGWGAAVLGHLLEVDPERAAERCAALVGALYSPTTKKRSS